MPYNFDTPLTRRGTGSAKWELYDADVLPLWVADMDFLSPPPVIEALQARVAHGVFGYQIDSAALREELVAYCARDYGWQVTPQQILFLPGLVTGINVVCAAVGAPGDGVLIPTPVYPPFLSAPMNQQRTVQTAELASGRRSDGTLYYEFDFDALERAVTPQTRLLLLCSPNNPLGRIWTRAELERLAAFSERHNLVICSDEIHADLRMGGAQHLPLAALSPEVAARTITLMAPSKTYNVPGLGCGFAIVQNPDLLKQVQHIGGHGGLVPLVNALGYTAALAAYRDGGEWLAALLAYLTANRDFLCDYAAEHFPDLPVTRPEGTYLTWMDCRAPGLENPYAFFLKEARVALNDGVPFGPGGAGFVRLNYACPRATLVEGLERMRAALARRRG